MPNPPTTKPVTVNVNFQTNPPTWTVTPQQLNIPHNDIDTVQWTLSSNNLPSGAAKAAFLPSGAIVFVTEKLGQTGSVWNGDTPTTVSDTLVEVSDNNTTGNVTRTYYYSINVGTYDQNGTLLNTYTKDPEIENEGQ